MGLRDRLHITVLMRYITLALIVTITLAILMQNSALEEEVPPPPPPAKEEEEEEEDPTGGDDVSISHTV